MKSFVAGLERLAFLVTLVLVSLNLGFVVSQTKIFPYSHLVSAKNLVEDAAIWVRLWFRGEDQDDQVHLISMPSNLAAQNIVWDEGATQDGYTFMSRFSSGRFELALVDMAGNPVHVWRVPDAVYKAADAQNLPLKPEQYEVMGSHLFPNGDVLFVINYRVLVKLDRCGTLQWLFGEAPHHDLEVLDDGRIWVLSRKTKETQHSATGKFFDDELVLLSPDGKVEDRISIFDAFIDSDYRSVVLEGPSSSPSISGLDVMHVNDIDVIEDAFARHHDFANAGDYAISLRRVDSVAIVDKDEKTVKWAMTGPFLRQHDPDFLSDGSILLFDNRTDEAQLNGAKYLDKPQRFGYSRVVQLDPETQDVIWSYEGSSEQPFYTSIQGDQQRLPNGNTLITESEGGRVFEVESGSNRIVWAFRNIEDDKDGLAWVGRITEARRYTADYPTFLLQSCSSDDL